MKNQIYVVLLALTIIAALNVNNTQAYGSVDSLNCVDDCVYPGDANNDGVVNELDVLSLGWSYNFYGPARSSINNDWNPYTSSDWTTSTPEGVNHKHSDCNGDGAIDSTDLTAIYLNFSLSYSKSGSEGAEEEEGVPFYLELNNDTFSEGDTVIASLILGTEEFPAEEVYGMIVNINYPNELLEWEEEVQGVDFSNSWLIPETGLSFARDYPEEGVLAIAVSKIDQFPVDGYGVLGEVYFIVIDNLDEKGIAEIPLTFSLSRTYLTDSLVSALPLSVIRETVALLKSKSFIKSVKPSVNIKVYPQPFEDYIILEGLDEGKDNITYSVYDISGKEMVRGALESNRIDLEDFDHGMYLLQIKSHEFIYETKILR